eukprot:TRINITY_DN1421_c0_g1_i1.p1 TRINITY_DN1421_c0_g1~~TRINITY_DN1421_c0_g1_i1.p1  ORF type:complete len:362 (+),score=122.07 TRINITY_DN1421_c0_g1_i1:103-1086(+)
MSWGARPTQSKQSGWGAKPSSSSPTTTSATTTTAPTTTSSWGAKPGGASSSTGRSGGGGGGWGAKPTSQTSAAPAKSSWGGARPGGWASANAQSTVSKEDLKDANKTTGRMLAKLEETNMIADATIDTMVEQNEQLSAIQDDLAEVHNDINYSEKKLASTKDFFGNVFKKKRVNHHKARAKGEKEYAKERMDESQAQLAADDQRLHDQTKELEAQRSEWASGASKDLHAAKKAGKANRKAGGESEGGSWQSGNFMFEERLDGTGEQVQAEEDLEHIYRHVKDLNIKAKEMGQLGEQSLRQVQNIDDETVRAQMRTKKNIEREEKILK